MASIFSFQFWKDLVNSVAESLIDSMSSPEEHYNSSTRFLEAIGNGINADVPELGIRTYGVSSCGSRFQTLASGIPISSAFRDDVARLCELTGFKEQHLGLTHLTSVDCLALPEPLWLDHAPKHQGMILDNAEQIAGKCQTNKDAIKELIAQMQEKHAAKTVSSDEAQVIRNLEKDAPTITPRTNGDLNR